jgi:hypothetical protein
MKNLRALTFLVATVFVGSTGSSSAYLGSFEESDGYSFPGFDAGDARLIKSEFLEGDAWYFFDNNNDGDPVPWVPGGVFPNAPDLYHGPDVTRYNAGEYGEGTTAVARDIIDNSGLWTAVSGGRLNEDADADLHLYVPQYYDDTLPFNPAFDHRDYILAYGPTVNDKVRAHSGEAVLNVVAMNEPLQYRYALDSRDFGGTAPSTTGNSVITATFQIAPSGADDALLSNMLQLGFLDERGNEILNFGVTGDNKPQFRFNGNKDWKTASDIALSTTGWNEVTVTIDLFSNLTSLWITPENGKLTSIFEGVPLAADFLGLAQLEFGLQNSKDPLQNDNNLYDDFKFTVVTPVPEPSVLAGTALAAVLHGTRRRRMDRRA